MTSDVKIGDVVAWAYVPDGTLVRWLWDGHGLEYFYRRRDTCVSLVGSCDGVWCPAGRDDGAFASSEPVTVIALNLTGHESAADLQRLAEVYEVREATFTLDEFEMPADLAHVLEELAEEDDAAARVLLARCLHAAGWRPGMTAEDAARLAAQSSSRP